jgi:hypothetical protein
MYHYFFKLYQATVSVELMNRVCLGKDACTIVEYI